MENRIMNKIKKLHKLHKNLIIDGFIVGILAGISSILYRFMLTKLSDLRFFLYNGLNSAIILIMILIVIGFVVGKLLNWESLSTGSGIPQVKAELTGEADMKSGKVIVSKFIGGGLANLAGLSLGREGPSIQIGAAVSKIVARIMKKDSTEERYMITAGTSAGLSAAFNAPIAGTLFALEEMHKSFSSLVLIPCLIAAAVADFISKNVFGLKPAFSFKVLEHLPLNQYYNLIILGIVCGLVGVLFNKTLLFSQDLFKKMKIKQEYKLIIMMLLAGLVGYFSYELLGGGHDLLDNIAVSALSIKILVFYLVAKLLFTTLSYGSKAQGGIFLPILVLGGLVGSIYFTVLDGLIDISSVYYANFIILGMAAIMTAVVRSPVISILLVSEMTGGFSFILGLCVVSIIAYIVAQLLRNEPIYESLLARLLNKEEMAKEPLVTDQKTLLKVDISLMGEIVDQKIGDIKWPCKMLIVAIERDGHEFFPGGEDTIKARDEITVLIDRENISCVKDYFKED